MLRRISLIFSLVCSTQFSLASNMNDQKFNEYIAKFNAARLPRAPIKLNGVFDAQCAGTGLGPWDVFIGLTDKSFGGDFKYRFLIVNAYDILKDSRTLTPSKIQKIKEKFEPTLFYQRDPVVVGQSLQLEYSGDTGTYRSLLRENSKEYIYADYLVNQGGRFLTVCLLAKR